MPLFGDRRLDPSNQLEITLKAQFDLEFLTNSAQELESLLLESFSEELLKIAQCNVLSNGRNQHLTEEDLFVGSISTVSKEKRTKSDNTFRMDFQTDALFQALRDELNGDLRSRENRLWTAFIVAEQISRNNGAFGARTFGWIAIEGLLKLLKI